MKIKYSYAALAGLVLPLGFSPGELWGVSVLSFCTLIYISFRTKFKQNNNKLFHSIFFILLVLLTGFYSMIFLTRSVFVCSLILLFAYYANDPPI